LRRGAIARQIRGCDHCYRCLGGDVSMDAGPGYSSSSPSTVSTSQSRPAGVRSTRFHSMRLPRP
jgi:hypothetical protein